MGAPGTPERPDQPGKPDGIDLWRAILPLGNGEAAPAVARADEVDRLAHALTHPRVDKKTDEFLGELGRQLLKLDLGGLYDLLPGDPVGGRKKRPFIGRNFGPKEYYLSLFPTGKERPGEPLGRLDGEFRLRPLTLPVTNRDGFEAAASARIGMSGLTYQQVARVAESTLDLLERAAHRSLWQAVHAALPTTARFFERFVAVDASKADVKYDPAIGSYFECDVTFRLKEGSFKGVYPEFYDYLSDLGDLFHFDGGLWNGHGEALARFEIDSQRKTLRVRFLTQGGRVLPIRGDGRPSAQRAVRLSELSHDRFTVSLQGRVHLYGTTFNLKRYDVQVSLEGDGKKVKWTTAIDRAPVIEVSDTVLYVVPQDLADFFVTDTIRDHTRDFFEALALGSDGKGSRLETEFVNGEPGSESLWRGEVLGAVLDNLLVKLTLRQVGDSVIPKDEAAADWDRFVRDFYGHFSADYRSARTRLLSN